MLPARINLFWLIVFGCTMPLAVVLSTHLARRSFENVKLRDQTITVKGYAERAITSDRASWAASFTRRNPDRTAGYVELADDRGRLMEFLARHGFAAEQVALSPVHIRVLYTRDKEGNVTNTIEGYQLSQNVSIASPDVALVARVARDASNLISEGIELDSTAPEYLYTKLEDMKLTMLAQATANGRQRAEKLVSNSPNKLGALRSASQGVFQITPAFSTEVSNSGLNDTSSVQKVIKAVVTLEYAIE